MQESFLHYIWQFQYFDKRGLAISSGEKLEVFFPGTLNDNAGPDFSNAKIKLANMHWAGSVEIHVKSSGWYEHRHDADAAYENVVLHVVWNEDREVRRNDGTPMPTLVLKDRVDEPLIARYKRLAQSPSAIPCEKIFPQVSDLVKHGMLDKALMQRLEGKAAQVAGMFKALNNDWEETAYQLMARNFGFKINTDPFSQLANVVRRKMLLKHSDSLLQIEALLFGQAGFLEYGIKDGYFKELQREHKALSAKYGIGDKGLIKGNWKFLRLRPANFPTIRIAQFAALFFKHKNFFSKLVEVDDVAALFETTTSGYWHTHYRFGHKAPSAVPNLGRNSINNLVINTVAPLLVAYGKAQDDQAMVDKAVGLLQGTPAEKNKITRAWKNLGLTVKDAFDSQALIELNNNYCLKRKCLACNIGIDILKPNNK